jgi:fatty-acyl-CoA synthase
MSAPMLATMMHLPMSTQIIMRHGARNHANATVVSYGDAGVRRARYAEVAERAARLAAALTARGYGHGARIASFCWNHQEHLEAYLAVPGIGAVLHTLNIRLFADQLGYIVNHAEDRVIIADHSLLPLLVEILPRCPSVELVVIIGGDADLPGYGGRSIAYEALIAEAEPLAEWPMLDENAAAVACYTSGTTGNPKGVVYSHKTIFAHSLASMGVDTFAISQSDRILLLPPMFHANAWGLPYSGWFAGADFIMPGANLKSDNVRVMIEAERPTFTAMVPTLVNDLLRANVNAPIDMSSFRVIVSGGAAVAPTLIDRVRACWGVPMIQGWGMTETSPLCALSVPPAGTPADQETAWRAKSGRPVPGIEVRIVDQNGAAVPHDGDSVGELELRGPWVARGYHAHDQSPPLSRDGWLQTGDVGTIDPAGYVQIVDRVKDMIKSGGEWISSVELENLLLQHPDVAEVAVIALPDERWDERPLAVLVPGQAAAPQPAALRRHLSASVARFWLPDYWAVVTELPRTSVGKIDKRALRALVADGGIAIVRDASDI